MKNIPGVRDNSSHATYCQVHPSTKRGHTTQAVSNLAIPDTCH